MTTVMTLRIGANVQNSVYVIKAQFRPVARAISLANGGANISSKLLCTLRNPK